MSGFDLDNIARSDVYEGIKRIAREVVVPDLKSFSQVEHSDMSHLIKSAVLSVMADAKVERTEAPASLPYTIQNCAYCKDLSDVRFSDARNNAGWWSAKVTCHYCWQSVNTPIAQRRDHASKSAVFMWTMSQSATTHLMSKAPEGKSE